jgi:exopolyphosphatase/guanosine-5'-triphosphate,3'-diphosphate pyrophosphatase
MQMSRRAVIDVGTNSIKLLVADVAGHEVTPLVEDSRQTRLGRGFYETHQLRPEAVAITAEVVAAFAEVARQRDATSIRVIATSAARDARNPRDLTTAIHRASGLRVEIISGEQEADWAFQGVTTDPELAKVPLLLLDVGGGSTEFILGQGEHKHFRQSFPIGTVRLLEKLPHGNPPDPEELDACRAWLRHFLDHDVRAALAPALRREVRLDPARQAVLFVGTGGTTTILARMEAGMDDYNRERIEATRLTLNRVQWHLKRLWSLPLEQRKQTIGLPENRADVILMGVAIYEAVMEGFGFTELRVSTRGLRFAAVMDSN